MQRACLVLRVVEVTGSVMDGVDVELGALDQQAGRESFDDFVRREQAGLVGYATLLSGSRVQGEDIVQDVLVRVLARWARLADAPAARLAYVRRAVTNEHVSWRRRWATRHIHYVAPDTVPEVAADPVAARDEELWQRLQALPPQQRAAVVLRYYESQSDAEIAELLGCREGTVRGHISRGLATLRSSDGGGPR